ncbi:MAG: DNA internalization-related competence protein ComEC/Rec2 [Candidatus Omnitrophota bacterium]
MKRLLVVFVIFFIVGIISCGTLREMPREVLLIAGALSVMFILLSVLLIKRNRLFYMSVCLFFLVFGIFNYLRFFPKPNDIGKFMSAKSVRVVVYGKVCDNPENRAGPHKKHFVFSVEARKILINGQEILVSGKIYVKNFKTNDRVYLGENIVLSGKLMGITPNKNEYGFNYQKYLTQKGLRAVMFVSERDMCIKVKSKKTFFRDVRRYLHKIRLKGEEFVTKYCSKNTIAVITAIVLGTRSDLNPAITDIFVKTGTMHILAISGLHLAIFSLVIMWFLNIIRFPKLAKLALTIIVLALFTLLTGPKVSCSRAFFMMSFVLMNSLIHREPDVLTSLMLSAFIILLFNPGEIFNLGFILSYISVFAIVFLTPLFNKFFNTGKNMLYGNTGYLERIKRYSVKSISATVAVWIAIMPIIAFNFQIVTPSVVVANIVAIPILFITITLSFVFFLSLTFSALVPITKVVAGILNFIIPFFLKILYKISEIPCAFVNIASPGLNSIIFFYCGLISIFIWFLFKKHKSAAIILVLFTANFFLWQEVLYDRSGIFRCTFFDVGKADSALMEFTDGRCMLIDCGNGDGFSRNDDGRNIIAPYLRQKRIKKIDCILITHLHKDHIGGLGFLLKNFKIGTIIINADSRKSGTEERYCNKCLEIAKRNQTKCLMVEKGDVIKGFLDIGLKILSPDRTEGYSNENDRSIVVRVETSNGNSILFCADISAEVMKNILKHNVVLKSDIIKIPHHGNSLGDKRIVEDFIKNVKCKNAIITNKFDGFDKDIVALLKRNKIRVYVTGESGAVTVREIGECFKVHTFFAP